MKTQDLINLLNRAAAVIEQPNSETTTERAWLIADLTRAAKGVESIGPLLRHYGEAWEFATNALRDGPHEENLRHYDELIQWADKDLRNA